MNRHSGAVVLVCAVASLPGLASAQTTVNGAAEWSVASNESTSNTQASDDRAIRQNYLLGYSSTLWDPRLVKFNVEGLFRTNTQAARAGEMSDRQGRQADLGYKFGASLLQASAIPFFVQVARTTSASSGDLGASNPVRSGMIAPTGAPPVDFESLNKTMSLGWQIGLPGLPRVDLGYRRGESVVTGGGYRAEQSDKNLSAAVSKDTETTRQSVRYQRTAFENVLAQTFAQKLSNLDYDLTAQVAKRLRVTAHAGRRMTFARSEFAATVTPADEGAYTPPALLGAGGAEYALAGIDYEPSGRFALRLNGIVDRQVGGLTTMSSRLATLSSHVVVARGLTATVSGTTGMRGQIVNNAPITVSTHSAVGGATYQAGVRWLSGSVGATRGFGTNVTPEGREGTTESWTREASLSSTFAWLGLGAGYERAQNRDRILDYGNYDSERVRASAQTSMRRLTMSMSAEQVRIERGVLATLTRNLQQTFSASGSVRVWRESLATVTAGEFINDYAGVFGDGRDRTLFWNVGGQSIVFSTLRFSAWVRSEAARASRTGYDQRVLSGFGRLDYRLRTLNLALEYQRNQSRLMYAVMPSPDHFRGRQIRFNVTRQFGMRLR